MVVPWHIASDSRPILCCQLGALVVALSLTVVAARQHHLNGFAIHMLRSILDKGVGLVEHIARLGAYHQSWVLLVA